MIGTGSGQDEISILHPTSPANYTKMLNLHPGTIRTF